MGRYPKVVYEWSFQVFFEEFWLKNHFLCQGMLQMAKFWPFLALVWSEVVETGIKSFVFYRESIPFYEFWLKNRFLSLGMIQMAKYGPFPAPMVSKVVGNGCKMILTTFYYTLVLWNFALKCTPGAADDPYLHPAVALKATVGFWNFWVFPHQMTYLDMAKKVPCLFQFLRFSNSIW